MRRARRGRAPSRGGGQAPRRRQPGRSAGTGGSERRIPPRRQAATQARHVNVRSFKRGPVCVVPPAPGGASRVNPARALQGRQTGGVPLVQCLRTRVASRWRSRSSAPAAAGMGKQYPLVYTGEGEPPTESPWGPYGRAATFAAVSAFSKLLLDVLNTTTCAGCDAFERAVTSREAGRPLVTVSNHASTLDDPCVLSAMLPWRFFATEASHGHVRWTLCANDICHQNRLLSDFFLAGKTLPIVRGGGQDQAIMQLMRDRLRSHGDWLHLFPEGRVRQDGQMNKLKSGLAHLLCGIADADPIVLPFHHRGMEKVLRVKTTLPHVGNRIHIIVGQPIEMADLLRRCRKVRTEQPSYAAAGAHARAACARRRAKTSRSSLARS